MFDCPFIRPPLVRLASLILFTVICGPPRLSVFLVINITWLYLMTALITCGHFLCDSNLTLSARWPSSSPTSPLSLTHVSNLSSATMGKSSTIRALATSSSLRAFIFACPAPTPRLRTVKLNALFVPLIMLFAHCSFRRPCLPPIGWRPSPLPLSSSTYCLPRLSSSLRLTLHYSQSCLRMIIFGSLVASVTPTCLPPLLINSLLGLLYVSF